LSLEAFNLELSVVAQRWIFPCKQKRVQSLSCKLQPLVNLIFFLDEIFRSVDFIFAFFLFYVYRLFCAKNIFFVILPKMLLPKILCVPQKYLVPPNYNMSRFNSDPLCSGLVA
jgi:hypothetical protein